MALATGQAIIIQALRKLGQIRAGYVPPAELLADGLNEWITLFDEWATDRTMGFSIPDYLYPVLGPGSQSGGNGYLIGPIYSFSGTILTGSPLITGVSDVSQVTVGERISGTGIPASTTVASVSTGIITMSQNATSSIGTTVTATPDFVGPRPAIITRANLKFTSGTSAPVYIQLRPISAEQWAALSIRQITPIDVTNVYYYDPQFPNGVFNVFPPLSGNSIELFCAQALAAPVTLGSAYTAPPGYLDAVVKSLAARMWSMIPNTVAINRVSQEYLNGAAYEACQKIQTLNRPIPMLRSDMVVGAGPDGFYDSNVTNTGLPT